MYKLNAIGMNKNNVLDRGCVTFPESEIHFKSSARKLGAADFFSFIFITVDGKVATKNKHS